MSKAVIRIEIPSEVLINNSSASVAQYIGGEVQAHLEDAEDNLASDLDDIEFSCDIEE